MPLCAQPSREGEILRSFIAAPHSRDSSQDNSNDSNDDDDDDANADADGYANADLDLDCEIGGQLFARALWSPL